jgi:ArsR family transcriptional regulator, lead/cadmium/zinc/bismuth-responsive transcriptional repressor
MVRRSILEQIFKEMMSVRQRLDNIENNFANWNPRPVEVPESSLITLPDHLRKTYVAVATKGECDAVQVSNQTGRCRAIESNYLNQLLRMGWLSKRRVSKVVNFRVISTFADGLVEQTSNHKSHKFPSNIYKNFEQQLNFKK